jgi:hypothetical protein
VDRDEHRLGGDAGCACRFSRPLQRGPAGGEQSNFTAVFDAPLGERINAISSAVELRPSPATPRLGTAGGHCSVPLESIMVDGDDTEKSEHFQQWATNKKVEPDKCTFDITLSPVKLASALKPKEGVPFTATGTFKICGRSKDSGGAEAISGTAMLFPKGSYGSTQTLRIRAKIVGFDRESYGISPKATAGWLARVEQLGPIVGAKGDIDLSLFAQLQ